MNPLLIDMTIRNLKVDEGFRKFPYKDSVGKLTIGYGHNLDDKGVTKEQAEWLLRDDLAEVVDVMADVSWFRELDCVRQYVVLNMAFNLGVPKFYQFKKTIEAIRKGDWNVAADEMLDSKWATQVGGRAYRLAEAMRTGEL